MSGAYFRFQQKCFEIFDTVEQELLAANKMEHVVNVYENSGIRCREKTTQLPADYVQILRQRLAAFTYAYDTSMCIFFTIHRKCSCL